MYFIPFETARLRLRPQEAKDAGFALCIWGDPITGKYLTDPALDTIDNLNEYMELLRHLNDSADCYYVIAEDKVTGQAIGTCCAVIKENGRCWDIGYCIHSTCWRKGYAKEMVGALVDFGIQNGVKTFLADVAADNASSCGVMCSLGFAPSENGTFRRIGTQRFQSKLLRMASQPPHSFPRKRPHAQYGHGFIQHFATHGPPEPRTQIRQ